MKVTVISDTVQEFDGVEYTLSGHYLQKGGRWMHVAVWEAFNGPVPDGWHVHHRDENKLNNDPKNLEAMPGCDHRSMHMRSPERVERSREFMANVARPAACKWHGSEQGREWHSRHYHENIAHLREGMIDSICQECGGKFEASVIEAKKTKFCSNKCKSAARRKSGVDDEVRSCVECGNQFTVNRYRKIKTCGSKVCSAAARKRTMGYLPAT